MAAVLPPPARPATPAPPPPLPRGRATAPVPVPGGPPQEEVTLERGQYDSSALPSVAPTGTTLEQLTRAARAASASDLYLSAGTVAMHRVAGGELLSVGTGIIEGDVIARELGVVAPPEARTAWSEQGTAMFTYGDGLGRVRATLARDHRGPSAALRLLPDDPPPLAQLRLGDAGAVGGWLGRSGLIVIAGPSGSGKTITLGALVRALGERRRRVVAIEDPIELVHASAWISQRAVGEHVESVSAGVACAMNEGADAIVIGRVCSEATAWGVVEAVSGGHLVLTTVVAPVAGVALDRMIAHLAADQRELAHGLLFSALLGTIQPIVGKDGARSFEITSPQT
jgi:twitching motility protein PilT